MRSSLDEVDLTLSTETALPPSARALDAWACHCDAIRGYGVADDGTRSVVAACSALGMDLGVLFVDGVDRVTRVVRIAQ